MLSTAFRCCSTRCFACLVFGLAITITRDSPACGAVRRGASSHGSVRLSVKGREAAGGGVTGRSDEGGAALAGDRCTPGGIIAAAPVRVSCTLLGHGDSETATRETERSTDSREDSGTNFFLALYASSLQFWLDYCRTRPQQPCCSQHGRFLERGQPHGDHGGH